MPAASSPSRLARLARVVVGSDHSRVLHPVVGDDGPTGVLERHGVDLLGQSYENTLGRRERRTNADITSSHAAVYAAVRWLERAVSRPRLVAERRVAGEWSPIDGHPALDAFRRANATLNEGQARALIERQLLTFGEAFWIKLRDSLGVVREFEIANPLRVYPVATKARPWEPVEYAIFEADGSRRNVPASEVIWFRHAVHPENVLVSLTPIASVRSATDTAFEAQRANQRYFDHGIQAGGFISGENVLQPEALRIAQQIDAEWTGTDNAHRWSVMEGDLTVTPLQLSNQDMQWIEQMHWTVEEVARAYELSPLALKDFRHATYQNAEQADVADWVTASGALNDTLATFNESCVWPDFGEDFRIVADYSDVPALQEDQLRRAEIDEVNLRSGRTYINEVRARDGQAAVAWGDEPLVATNVRPLSYEGAAAESTEPADTERALQRTLPTHTRRYDAERDQIERRWRGILRDELTAVLAHLDRQGVSRGQRVDTGGVDDYDWNWLDRYGPAVIDDMAAAFEAVLAAEGYVAPPTLTARQLAISWAEREAASLLAIDGRTSASATTRAAVRRAVAKALEEGHGPRELKNRLRRLYEFAPERAETIARTEMATAVGQGALQSATSQGRDEKRWRTARDEKVDGGDASGPCITNQRAGWIDIDEPFPSAALTVPEHPRCRCDVEYRTRRVQPGQG